MNQIANIFMLAVMVLNNLTAVMPSTRSQGAAPTSGAAAAAGSLPANPAAKKTPSGTQTATPTGTATAMLTETATVEPTETQTPTETATATLTREPTLTETVTPEPTTTQTPDTTTTPSATVEPTQTSLPTATETATPTETAPAVTLTFSSEPAFITPGGSVKVDWAVAGLTLEGHNLTLQTTLPVGIAVKDQGEGVLFDAATRLLTIPVGSESGQFHLRLDSPTGDVVLDIRLMEGITVLTSASLSLPAHEKFKLGKKGGEISALQDKVKIKFPANVLPENTTIEVGAPVGQSRPAYTLSGQPFEITAFASQPAPAMQKSGGTQPLTSSQTLSEISQFEEPVELQVGYDDAIYGEQEGDLHISWYNETTQEWETLASWVDTEANVIHAFTNHFTVFDIDPTNWQASHLPTMDSFQVAEYTGAGSFSYPIEVPPGPAGLQPSVVLSYNSQVVDQATSQQQASWVGMGWDLEVGAIERNTNGTTSKLNDDTYSLNVAGVSTSIVSDGTNFYTGDETAWKISRYTNDQGELVWSVWDKQGNRYYFEQVSKMAWHTDGDHCGTSNLNWLPFRWALTKIEDTHNNIIQYTYVNQTKNVVVVSSACVLRDVTMTTAVYLNTITYADGEYRVSFTREARSDYINSWDTDDVYHSYEKERLASISVDKRVGANSYENIRSYNLIYAAGTATDLVWPNVKWRNGAKTTTLRKIIRNFATPSAMEVITDYTFYYEDNLHLTKALNAYGGGVEFTYEALPWYYASQAAYSRIVFDYVGQTVSNKHGVTSGSCVGAVSTGSWGFYTGNDITSRAGTLSCKYNAGAPMTLLMQGNVTNPQPDTYLIRPGGVYKLTLKTVNTAAITIGLRLLYGVTPTAPGDPANLVAPMAGTVTSTTSGGVTTTSAIFRLPAAALRAEPLIFNAQNAQMEVNDFKYELLTSVYRVTQRTLSSTAGQTYTQRFNYQYNTPAVNDSNNSDICAESDATCLDYYEAYGQFRGHKYVTVSPLDQSGNPSGAITKTQYGQNDALRGRVLDKLVKDNLGNALVYNDPEYRTSILLAVQPTYTATIHYQGVTHYWIETLWVENRSYAFQSTHYQATLVKYTQPESCDCGAACANVSAYDAYGNPERQRTCLWNNGNWVLDKEVETSYRYMPSINLVSQPTQQTVKDAMGAVISQNIYTYDGVNLAKVYTLAGDGKYIQASFTYDPHGNRYETTAYNAFAQTGSNGQPGDLAQQQVAQQTTRTEFDSLGIYPQTITYLPGDTALQQISTLGYDERVGLPDLEIDANGAQTTAQYDGAGRLTQLVRPGDTPAAPTISITYHDETPFWTEITQKVDTDKTFTLRRYYDGLGRLIQARTVNAAVDGSNTDIVVDYYYDVLGRLKQQTTPRTVSTGSAFSHPAAPASNQAVTTTTYNALGQVEKVFAPDADLANDKYTYKYTYNEYVSDYASLGLVNTVADAKEQQTKSVVNALGQTVLVLPPTGPAVGYVYDSAGRLVKAMRATVSVVRDCLLDPNDSNCPTNDKTTRLEYNLLGQKIAMHDPDMGDWSYQYDVLGNLVTQRDARGQYICLYYDRLNRLTDKYYSASTCPASAPASPNAHYTYDAGANGKGRRTGMASYLSNTVSNTTAWTYDARGRMTQEVKNFVIDSGISSFVTQWTYNSADLPKTMTYPGSDNEVVTYTYNNQRLLTALSGTGTFGTVAYASGMTYDVAGRLTSRPLGNGLTQSYTYYGWSEKVNSVGQGARLKTLSTGTLQNLAYTYDAAGNVTKIFSNADGTLNNADDETQAYGYDGLDRLSSWTLNGTSQETYTYYADTGNLETKAGVTLYYDDVNHKHAVSSTSTNNTYGYDANGNQTTRVIGADTYTLLYDAENRLVEVKKNTVSMATFVYDGDGRQVKATVNGITTLYVGAHFEVTNPGSGQTITKYYFAGAGRIAMRKYVIPASTTLNYLLGDHLGSTSLVTSAAGVLIAETRYKPWGEVRYTTANTTLPTLYTFTGQRSYMNDEATDLGANASFGLMFYNARWYDPALGRFAQADSIVPGGVQGLDRYAYVNNSPVRYSDPSGHCVPDEESGRCWSPKMWDNPEYIIAYTGLKKLGIYGDKEKAMEYVVATEAGGGLANPNFNLFKAMTRRYYENCKGSAWSIKCVQSFWGYTQGVQNGSPKTVHVSADQKAMATAILNPGQSVKGENFTFRVPNGTQKNADGTLEQDWTKGCEDNGFCHWANGREGLVTAIKQLSLTCKDNTCALFTDTMSVTYYYFGPPDTPLNYFILFDNTAYDIYCGVQKLCWGE